MRLPRLPARRLAPLLLLACASWAAPVLAAPPSDADVNRLLSASRAQAMVSSLLPQMEAAQAQQFGQVLAHPALTPAQREQVQALAKGFETAPLTQAWEGELPLAAEKKKSPWCGRTTSRAKASTSRPCSTEPRGQARPLRWLRMATMR